MVEVLGSAYILGMAKMGGGVKILLDIDSVLSNQEFMDVASTPKGIFDAA